MSDDSHLVAASPASIEEAARTISRAAVHLGEGADRFETLARTLVAGAWSGPAAERFAEFAERVVLGERRVERTLSVLATALARFAAAVAELRDEFARAADAAGIAPALGAASARYHDARLHLRHALEEGRDEALALGAAVSAHDRRAAHEVAGIAETALLGLSQLRRRLGLRDDPAGLDRQGRMAKELRAALTPVGGSGWSLLGRIAWPAPGTTRPASLQEVLGRIPHAVLATLLGDEHRPEDAPPRLRLLERPPVDEASQGGEAWRNPEDG